jgi:hypothetical protein
VAKSGQKKNGSEANQSGIIDHCAVDPHFESMVWGFIEIEEIEEIYGHEVAMWRKVVLQTLVDYLSTAINSASRFNQYHAEKWFLYDEKDFFLVCDLANLNADRLRQMVRNAHDNPSTILAELRFRITRKEPFSPPHEKGLFAQI